MSIHAAPPPADCPPRTVPARRGTTANGVAMHSGLSQGSPNGSDDRRLPAGGAAPHGGATDSRWFRSVLGRFATGVVAITAIDPGSGEPCGLAANSFTSVSLEPPLIAFCVAHTSTSWPRLRAARIQTVNVLAEHQQPVCAALAGRGGDKFATLDWTGSPAGNPVIGGTLAWLDCSIEAEHPAGDHVIVVARVHDLGVHGDDGPLVFFQGGYGRFTA
ncbi:flavin reductase (DIM6/NTAB) family NADH-FMN oxidoreductase RutF [Streptosporangium becharense]|uniref:Flavin reductase (DIM6/NTAB) family NADH-FMN oxidoreductase RutF n=1 Tax=Streptosporangium becharense TaxID=1816182 RepID=A0A7W9MFX1_9ACTN|nr:flavin reductase family protein [Streptosporangium becharense]MBB2912302.1 flavin reductase (DIM6/NTAB) family NADH-FMN oxidoreductase RutF [Streptosporangium becharense]MBB5818849.1 flavin reductase (DIM6/NTAB) family NADH-FMN oxidoreductase RutF [Streptosporangium becharense]